MLAFARPVAHLAVGSFLAAPAFAQQSPTTPPVSPAAIDSGGAPLPAVQVTGQRIDYVPERTTAGSRTELPITDIPQGISVLNAEALRDLAPRVIDEIADYVAGVDREAVQGNPYGMSFYIRGFNTAGGATAINGFRDYGFNTPHSLVNIERIEFLKGPASVLYGGSGALSGLVNIVTKQPLPVAQHRVEGGIGSFNHRYATVDSTGPLNAAGTARYRLTAAIDKDGNFVNGTRQESRFISPFFSFDLGRATTVDLELVAQQVDRPGREPYYLRHPDFLRLPVRTQLGDPNSPDGDGGRLSRYSSRAELRHRFDNGLRFRQAFYASNVHSDDSTIQPLAYTGATQTLTRRVRAVDEYQRERYSQTELSGTTSWAGLQHQWLTGLELGTQENGYAFLVAPYSSINPFDPQAGTRLGPLTSPFSPSDTTSRTTAIYAQDLITLGGGFKAMLGARWDRLGSRTGERDDPSSTQRQKDTQISPRVGLIYEFSPRHMAYVSWNRSFRPNLGLSAEGSVFQPQRGRQVEVGWKGSPIERLQMTAALFDYRRQNVLTADANDPTFSTTVGEQRSRGFELEAAGTVVRGWQIIAAYGYMDAEVTRDNVLPVGDRLPGAPRHTFGLFNRVALGVPGLSATLGVSYASARPSGIPNDPAGPLSAADVELPSYVKWDAGLIYEHRRFEARLVGRNLTNERIYDGYISTFQPRAPRSVHLSIAWMH